MQSDYLSRIETNQGGFIVTTKVRYFGFLEMPRSSVMPFKTSEFLSNPGFQVHYNTSDPNILHEWHEMIVALVQKGLFQMLSDGARAGKFPYPDDKKHLQRSVKRFI